MHTWIKNKYKTSEGEKWKQIGKLRKIAET